MNLISYYFTTETFFTPVGIAFPSFIKSMINGIIVKYNKFVGILLTLLVNPSTKKSDDISMYSTFNNAKSLLINYKNIIVWIQLHSIVI